jgi:hypothetical protein
LNITEILPVPKSDNILSMLPKSGNGIQSAQILATKLVVFQPSSWNLAKTSQPERPASRTDLAKKSQPENLGSLLIGWDLARTTRFQQFWQSGRSVPGSNSFGRNPTKPNSDETVQIPAFISDSNYSSQNPVKIAGILSVSDKISSPVFLYYSTLIFICFE